MKYKSNVINYLTTIAVYMLFWLLYFMDIINAFVYIGTLLSGLIILLVLGIFFRNNKSKAAGVSWLFLLVAIFIFYEIRLLWYESYTYTASFYEEPIEVVEKSRIYLMVVRTREIEYLDDESLIRNSLKQGEKDFIDLYKLNNKIRYESKNTEILQWLRIQKDEFSVMRENVKLYLGKIGNIAGFLKREDLTGDSAGLGLVLTELIAQGKLENHITFGVTGAINSTGDVREIGMVKEKILIAEKMGFPYIIIPTGNVEDANEIKKKEKLTIEIIDVKNVDEAIRLVGKLNN